MPNKKSPMSSAVQSESQSRVAEGVACNVSENKLNEKVKPIFVKRTPRRHMEAWQYDSIYLTYDNRKVTHAVFKVVFSNPVTNRVQYRGSHGHEM